MRPAPNYSKHSVIVVECHRDHVLITRLQVIRWIEEHGETFLKKHTGVGKSLVKAEALLRRHEEFENIAQVGRNKDSYGRYIVICHVYGMIDVDYIVGYKRDIW
jgi:hypothetical protein